MHTDNLIQAVGKMGGRIKRLGFGLVALGALSVWAPQISGMTVSVIVGLILILGGIVRTMFAWLASGWGSVLLRAAVGVLTVVVGGYMIVQPDAGSQTLAIVLAVYLVVDGGGSLFLALILPRNTGRIWLMLGAISSLVVAVVMWMQWPVSGELGVGIYIGVKLLLDGVSMIGIGSAANSAMKPID